MPGSVTSKGNSEGYVTGDCAIRLGEYVAREEVKEERNVGCGTI